MTTRDVMLVVIPVFLIITGIRGIRRFNPAQPAPKLAKYSQGTLSFYWLLSWLNVAMSAIVLATFAIWRLSGNG